MDAKKKTKKAGQKKEYRYYDRIHKEYVDVPDAGELKSFLRKSDRRTEYIEKEQNHHNNTYSFSELKFFHEKYKSRTDKGLENVLHKICAEKFWADIASVLTADEMVFLYELYYKPLDKKPLPLYKRDDYEKIKSKRRRIFHKLKKYFTKHVGGCFQKVFNHYFC